MGPHLEAAREVQHLTLGEEVRMDALVQTRSALKAVAEAQGLKLTYMPLFIKAASMALAQHPSLNATTAPDMSSITLHASHNIGVAIDSPQGKDLLPHAFQHTRRFIVVSTPATPRIESQALTD